MIASFNPMAITTAAPTRRTAPTIDSECLHVVAERSISSSISNRATRIISNV